MKMKITDLLLMSACTMILCSNLLYFLSRPFTIVGPIASFDFVIVGAIASFDLISILFPVSAPTSLLFLTSISSIPSLFLPNKSLLRALLHLSNSSLTSLFSLPPSSLTITNPGVENTVSDRISTSSHLNWPAMITLCIKFQILPPAHIWCAVTSFPLQALCDTSVRVRHEADHLCCPPKHMRRTHISAANAPAAPRLPLRFDCPRFSGCPNSTTVRLNKFSPQYQTICDRPKPAF